MTGKANLMAWSRVMVALVIVPNVLFAVAPRSFSMSARGLINLDYLAAGFIVCGQRRAMQVVALALGLATDFVDQSLVVYHFTPKDLSGCAGSLLQIPAQRLLECVVAVLAAAILIALAMTITASKILEDEPKKARLILSVAILVTLMADIANGTNGVFRISETRSALNIASSPMFSIGRSAIGCIGQRPRHLRKADRIATQPILSLAERPSQAGKRSPNLVVVLVESFGRFNDRASARELAKPFDRPEIRSRYDVQEGETPFVGATVAGELRELCGLVGDIDAFPLSQAEESDCLPRRLAGQGYRSTAIHGYSGRMFDRRTWYGEVGFAEELFLEELGKQLGNRRCGGFLTGACDADVADLIRSRLTETHAAPSFLYWVTLNSHLPTPRETDSGGGLECESTGLREHDICVWGRLIYNVNDSIAKVAADRKIQPTEFIVVGDHAPPFWLSRHRDLFSASTVPYFRLIPREN